MPIGLKLAEPKLLVSYMVFLTILSIMLATLLAIGYGLYLNMVWMASGGSVLTPVVVDVSAKTVYTSRVPLSVYVSLSKDRNVGRIVPVVLAISILKGRSVTVRGMRLEDLKLDYSSAMLEGSMPGKGFFAIVGFKAAEKFDLKAGGLLHLTSVKSGRTLTLVVSGIYRLGDQRDYEIVVNIELARLLSDMPSDCLSLIVAPEAVRSYLEDKLKATYNLTIEYHLGFEAIITLTDSLGRVCKELKVSGNSTHQITLPYGYYSIYIKSNGKISFIDSILLDRNTAISLRKLAEKITLRVPLVSKDTAVELKSMEGETIEPAGTLEGYLIYSVERGIYKLTYDNKSYLLNLSEDSTFTPFPSQPAGYTLKIRVYDYLGRRVRGVILNIIDPRDNKIVYGRLLEEGEGSLTLPPGRYRILVSDSLTLMERSLELRSDSLLEFELPTLNKDMPSRIISEMRRVKPLEGVDYVELSFKASLGLTLEHYIALYLSLTTITLIAFIPVNIYYISSIRERLKLLVLLGFKPGGIILRAGLPSLSAASLASVAGFYLFNCLWEKFSLEDKILILGYGLPSPKWWLALPVIASTIILWIYCFNKELNKN
ncbi:MAG: hypothetical protein QXX99_00310 [Candidatus Bathyarchaeia archaeon]